MYFAHIYYGSYDIDGTVAGYTLIFMGLVTGVLNLAIASKLEENKVRGFILGLGWGIFLSVLAPLFLIYRFTLIKSAKAC